jgi:acyl-CoA-dependent ceramide synthase
MIFIVLVLWGNWELLAPYAAPSLPNPFAPLIFLSYYLPDSSPDAPGYAKGSLVRLS